MLCFFWLICHISPRYNHAFTEKAQHLQRWIPLRTFTRGRLVPRQPRAIKRTTPTALHHERIYITIYIYWNTSIKPTALHRSNIHNSKYIYLNIGIKSTALRRCYIHNSIYIHGNIGITSPLLHRYNASNSWCIHWNISIKFIAWVINKPSFVLFK